MLAAVASGILKHKRATFYDRTAGKVSPDSLNNMSWLNFEFLVAEYFRRLHFSIEETKGEKKIGVNFTAKKGGEKYLIQCRQLKSSQVGIDDIRGFPEVVSTAGTTGGIVVISGEFTKEAMIFARANNIMLLDGNELRTSLNSHKIFDPVPELKLIRRLKNLAWVCAGILVIGMGGSFLYHYKTGTPIVWIQQAKKFLAKTETRLRIKNSQISQPTGKATENDKKFTDEQIKNATEKVLHKREQEQFKKIETGKNAEKTQYNYELELVNGGRIFTDNIEEKDDKVSYKNNRGLIVSLNRNEVKSMRKIELKK